MIGLHRSPNNARVGHRFVQFYEIASPQQGWLEWDYARCERSKRKVARAIHATN